MGWPTVGARSACPGNQSIVILTVWEISPKTQETRFLVALLSAKLLTLGIIQVYLILHSLIRNIVSIEMTDSLFDMAYVELTLF